MLNLSRFLEIAATTALDGVLSMTVNQETQDVFCVFSGTWKAFNTSKAQIIHYLKCHPDIGAIWVAVDDDTKVTKRQKPFMINWVGLYQNGSYVIEVRGQQSERIAGKWSSILAKELGGDVNLFWM